MPRAVLSLESGPLVLRPFQIVSLLNVIKLFAETFCWEIAHLEFAIGTLDEASKLDEKTDLGELAVIRHGLSKFQKMCESFEMTFSVEVIEGSLVRLNQSRLGIKALHPTNRMVIDELRGILKALYIELETTVFMCIPRARAKLYDQPELFGLEVSAKFREANKEVTQAGNCLAAGNSTATVFHLMRALEHGLRALAKRLRVKYKRSLKTPTDLRDWGDILTAIEDKVDEIEQKPRTHKREADLRFYHGAVAQFRHFKNAWRNHVMHARVLYEGDEAGVVMRHVSEFMQHLATRLKE